MSRKTDLEESIRESYGIINEYEKIRRLSDRPEEKLRAERYIQKQWELIGNDLSEYNHLVNGVYPSDIVEIAAHFEVEPQLNRNKDGEFLDGHRQHLQALLAQHSANLRELEQQKALYGIEVPLHIINSIEKEKVEIDHIKRELSKI